MFKLDRFTGQVWQLVKDTDDNDRRLWQEMDIDEFVPLASSSNKQPRFQIFTSGKAARHTFLIDTFTGATWICGIVTDEQKKPLFSKWFPITHWIPKGAATAAEEK